MATFRQLIDQARVTLNDANGERYPDPEMFAYAVDGMYETAALRPDLFAVVDSVPLVAGVEQNIPPTSWFLISVEKNALGNEVPEVSFQAWHRYDSSWRTATPGPTEFWMRFPDSLPHQPVRKFYVYPPAVANDQLVCVLGQCDVSSLTIDSSVPLSQPYHPAVVAYLIYRAESKEDQHVLSQRAPVFFKRYVSLLGVAQKAEKP